MSSRRFAYATLSLAFTLLTCALHASSAPWMRAHAQETEVIETSRSKLGSEGGSLPPSGFEVGQRFPDVAFPTGEPGRWFSISEFRGRKVVLHIFASW